MKRILIFFFSSFIVLQTSAQDAGSELKPIRFDRNHSTFGFTVPIMNGLSHVTGKFRDFSASLTWNEEDLSQSSVKIIIPVSSIDTGIDNRDSDIQEEHFFDEAHFPEITFESTDIRKNGSDYLALGTFTMHGISKDIALSVRKTELADPDNPDRPWRAWHVRYRLDRRDYGINWTHTIPGFVGFLIDIDISLLER